MNVRYFDNAATTRVKDEVLEEMLPYLKEKGNRKCKRTCCKIN